MNELGNTPADKNYQPSGISSAEDAALKAYPNVLFPFTPLDLNAYRREAFIKGYEQAKKDINREMLDMMNEIREKQAKVALEDLNYTIKIDPALGFDEGSAVVYHGKEIISELTWEDAQLLHIITEKYMRELDNRIEAFPSSSQEVFEEILRRFKEAKK